MNKQVVDVGFIAKIYNKKAGRFFDVPYEARLCVDLDYKLDYKKEMHSFKLTEQTSLLFREGPCKVLDLGCGPNAWSYPKYSITSVDIDPDNIVPWGKIHDLNKNFPFPDGSFDLVLGTEIIEHLENPWHFIRECKRVVKTDGDIIITSPFVQSESSVKLLGSTGRLNYFQEHDMKKSGSHITPIFTWQIEKICKENNLYCMGSIYTGLLCKEPSYVTSGIPPLFEPIVIYWLRNKPEFKIEGLPKEFKEEEMFKLFKLGC